MNILKTSALSFLATVIKILSGLVINKFVSIMIGPSGLAVIGQLQNAINMMMTIAKGGINSGVTKYTSEYNSENDSDNLYSLWSTGLIITLICSVLTGLFSFCFSETLSVIIFSNEHYSYVFNIIGLTITLFSLNQYLLSILNGLKKIRLFISINITQSIYGLVFTSILIYFYRLDGALIAIATNQSVVFVTTLYRLRKNKKIEYSRFKKSINSVLAWKLSSYSLMALCSACTLPISLLLVRNLIGEELSWDYAGYWQAMWYISSTYLLVITTTLSTYYLPRLSELRTKHELLSEVSKAYLIIIPLALVSAATIYVMRDFIIYTLFSSDFVKMKELFLFQLIGDVVKIFAWLISYMMLAKAMTKIYIFGEIIFSFSFVTFSHVMLDKYGFLGVSYSYLISYLIYFIYSLFFVSLYFVRSSDDKAK